MKKQRKNKRAKHTVFMYAATEYYLRQLARQMGMTLPKYIEFALQNEVTDRWHLLTRDVKWKP